MARQNSNPANTKFDRPSLPAALAAWETCLKKNSLPASSLWVFSENLCIEASDAMPGSFRVGFQTKFTPVYDDALPVAYEYFGATDARMVFYRLGSANNQSVSILLCDPWFEEKTARDHTFISDILEGILACTNREFGFEIFNLGESQTIKLFELIAFIEDALGKKAIIDRQPLQPGDVPLTFADIAKAQRMLGYEPKVKVDKGIPMFVEWFRNQQK